VEPYALFFLGEESIYLCAGQIILGPSHSSMGS
jgi:hypothetical protein